MSNNIKKNKEVHPEFNAGKITWADFTPELSWFIYDFFKHKLNGYEKLLFFGYYIQGFTFEELGERFHVSFQAVQHNIKSIDKKLKKTWDSKESWRANNDNK